MAMTKEQQRALALARARQRQQQGNEVVGRGGILPFSRQADGDIQFDSDAGVVGAIKRAFFLPGEVMAGEVDPLSDEGIDRAAEMAAVANPANPAVRAGDRLIPGASRAMRKPDVKAPTAQELKAEAKAGYRGVRESGVDYTGEAVRDLAQAARSDLERKGLFAPLTPKTDRLLRGLQNPPPGSFSEISQVAAARRGFGRVNRSPEHPEDFAAGQNVRQRVANFITDPPEEALVDRTPAGVEKARSAGRLQRESDGNYAAAKRSDTINELRRTSEIRAGVNNSGQNLDNATRQRLASLLLNERRNAGFIPAEKQAIEQVAMGSRPANALRRGGNLIGGGQGLGGMLAATIGAGAGGAAAGPVGGMIGAAMPIVAGSAMKGGAARLTQRGLGKIDEQTRKRSPLYERRVRETPMEADGTTSRTAPVRGAMIGNMSTEDATQAIRQVQAAQREGRISASEARQIIALISGNGA